MAVVQSTYTNAIPNGYPGMVANGETSNRISRSVEDAGGLAFGKAGFRGAGDHGCTGTPTAGKFLGIAIATAGVVQTSAAQPVDAYPQYGSAGLHNMGVIWASASVAVAKGDPVFVTPAMLFTNVAGGNVAIPATFDDTITGPGIARLRVVLPSVSA